MEKTVNLSIFRKIPRFFRKTFRHPKFWLKDLLIYLNRMRPEQDIDFVIGAWVKDLLVWLLDVSVTGFMFNITFFVLFGLTLTQVSWFYWGLFWYMAYRIWRAIVNGKKEIRRA